MKTFWGKLFDSPTGKGFRGSPFIFLALGGALMFYALIGLLSGEMDVGRYSENVVRYSENPGWFLFCVVGFFGLGAGMVWWGRRLFGMHDDG